MQIRSNIYMLLAIFACVIVIGIVAFTAIIAAVYTVSPSDFPVYSYDEYIDRSADMTFTADGGAQLYEAEDADPSGDARAESADTASGGYAVGGMSGGAGISFSITADRVCSARLFLSACYIPESGASVMAENLLSVRCNGAKTGMPSAEVSVCGSPYDYRENELCTVELRSGMNEIEITAETGGFSADYMVLVSSEPRTSSDGTIGVPSQPYSALGGTQRFEAESAGGTDGVPFAESEASSGYFVRLMTEGAGIAFYPESDGNCTVSLSMAVRSTGSSARVTDLCSLRVNGMETNMYAAGMGASDRFVVLHAADIALGAGVNEVLFTRKNGVFDIDYIELVRIEIELPNDGGIPV